MNILIFQQRGWGVKIGIPLAKFLKEKIPEAKFAAFVYKPKTWNALKKDDFQYEYKWLGYKLDDGILEPDFEDKCGSITTEEIEKELGIDSVWKDLIHIDRSLVYTPGKKFRYSWKKQVTDKTALNLVKFNYHFVVHEVFGKFNPDIIICPGVGSLFHNVLFHYAKKRSVKMWLPTATKISGEIILTDEKMYTLPNVQARYNKQDFKPESADFAKEYLNKFRTEFIPPAHLKNKKSVMDDIPKQILKEIIRLPKFAIKTIRNNKNPLHPKVYKTTDHISLTYEIKGLFAKYRNIIQAKNYSYYEDKHNDQYFYFPLHVQPEISTNLWAPYFTNQLETIRQIAISLPGKYTLFVKEHPVMIGWRTKKFYDKLSGLPNVKLISPRAVTSKIIADDRCKGVIVISGTTGFESLIMKKPTIVLCEMFYTMLPHCFRVQDITSLPEVFRKIDALDLNSEEIDKALIHLIASLKEDAIALNYSGIWGHGQQGDKTPLFDEYLKIINELKASKENQSTASTLS